MPELQINESAPTDTEPRIAPPRPKTVEPEDEKNEENK